MNTGLLRHAVATVLTVYGIETELDPLYTPLPEETLQQCLPFTVLKPILPSMVLIPFLAVATVLTVYGIETVSIIV